MAQQITTGKNRGVGETRDFGRVQLDVVHPTNVQARQTDPTAVLQALDQFSRIEQRRVSERLDEDREQGYRDSALGKADEERIANSKAYAEGASANRVETEGLRLLNGGRQRLTQALKEDPNLDYAQWEQDELQAFLQTSGVGQSKLGMKELNRYVAQFRQQMSSQHAQVQARMQLQEAEQDLANNFTEMLNLGTMKPEQLAQWKATRAARSGLDDDEVNMVIGNALLGRLGNATSEEEAESLMTLARHQGLDQQVQWADNFTKERAAVSERIERERLDVQRKDVQARLEARSELGALATQGKLSVQFLAKGVEEGRYMQDEVEWAWGHQASELARQRAAAEREARRAKKNFDIDRLLDSSQEEMLAVVGAGHVKMKDIQAGMDRRYAQAWLLTTSDDEQEQQDGIAALGSVLQRSQDLGIMPMGVKFSLNQADTGTPARFIRNAEGYRKLAAAGYGDFIRNGIDSGSYAKLERYRRLVEDGGMTEQQAVHAMNSSPVKLEEAQRQANSLSRGPIAAKAAELIDDMDLSTPGVVAPLLREYTVAHIAAGEDEQTAVDNAVKQFKDRFAVVDGIPVPRLWTASPSGDGAEALSTAWPTYKDRVLLPALREKYGEDEMADIRIAPAPNRPGQFMLYRPNDVGPMLEDGKIKTIGLRDILGGAVKVERDDAEMRRAAQPVIDEKARAASLVIPGLAPTF